MEGKKIVYSITSSVVLDTSYVLAHNPNEAISKYCTWWKEQQDRDIYTSDIQEIKRIGDVIE